MECIPPFKKGNICFVLAVEPKLIPNINIVPLAGLSFLPL